MAMENDSRGEEINNDLLSYNGKRIVWVFASVEEIKRFYSGTMLW